MQVLRTAFTEPLDPAISKLVTSIEDDKQLVSADLQGSMAHCAMLAKQGLISQEQADSIHKGLELLAKTAAASEFELHEEFEDVHMNVEKKLEAAIGENARKLHTARSRNDQVALDFRLYVSKEIGSVMQLLITLQQALLQKAVQYPEAVMPGYTHLQRAQPVFWSHALLAFREMLSRDVERFQQSLKHTLVSPLGAGAQAGTSLPIDPAYTATLLNMSETFVNSIDAVMDRDFAAEFLFNASLCSIHLSQLCETLIIWNTTEFGFIKFSDCATTSSSLMPQKKNPDPVELVRGKAGAAVGELMNLLMTLKGLPLGYNRDLQETKGPVIRTVASLRLCLDALPAVIQAISIQDSVMKKAAADPDLMATDLVEYLVNKGVAFRNAHESVANAVALARSKHKQLCDLSLSQFQTCCEKFDEQLYEVFDPVRSAQAKKSPGGTASSDERALRLQGG